MCPVIKKEITECDFCPWYNSDIKKAKRKRRKAETIWRQNKTCVSRAEYLYQRNSVNRLIDHAKRDYYYGKISECGGDYKKLYLLVNNLLGKRKSISLPEYDCSLDFANDFAEFFLFQN
jgi:hypothetical protein